MNLLVTRKTGSALESYYTLDQAGTFILALGTKRFARRNANFKVGWQKVQLKNYVAHKRRGLRCVKCN